MREGIEPRLVSPELVGRDSELSTIGRLVGAVSTGSTATLLLSGEAGMGKSALLARAREIARRAGLRVLRGECVRFEMGRAFGPFIDALHAVRDDPAAAAALALAPDADRSAGSERYQAHGTFVRAFAAVAEERPMLLAIDDLHWADGSTLELFAHLSRRLPAGTLLAGTYRPEEVERRPALRRAIGDLPHDRTVDLSLRRLTATEASRALRLILGEAARVPADTREVLQAASAGNPLFLEEILRALAHRGELHRVEGEWRIGRIRHVPLPASVHDAVRERLAGLDPTSLDVMMLAATIGERFDLGTLRRASATTESVVPAVREAVAAQLVLEVEDDRPDRFAFRHPLIRDAILDGVLGVERRTLHRRVAEAIEGDGAPDEALSALAYHWDEAGDRERAFACHVRAAEHEARRLAHAEALAHFRRALDLAPSDDRTVADLSMRGADMAKVLARAGHALDLAAKAAERYERLGDRRALGLALLEMYGASSAMLWPRTERGRLIDRAFAALEPLGDTPELVRAYAACANFAALCAATHGGSRESELPRALAAAERAVALSERFGDDRANPYWGLAVVHMVRDDPAGAIDALRRGVAEADDDRITAPWQITNLSILADLVERRDGRTEEVATLRQRAERLRERYGVMRTHMARLHALFLSGEWDEYIRIHDDHADDEGESAYVRTHHALHRAFIDVARAGPSGVPAARAAYAEVLRAEEVSESDAVAVPEVALLVGDHAWALEATERGAELVTHPHPYGPFIAFAGIYAVLAARDARDEAAAARWLARFPPALPPATASFNLRVVEEVIRYGAIERDWRDGERDRAIDALAALIDERRALSADHGRTTFPGLGVWPLLSYFLALREIDMRVERGGPKDLERAAARLDWVVGFYRTCRATWYLERLRERAAAHGIPFPSDPDRPAVTPRITGREREVAVLVARGLTNKEIAERLTLSVRTVESHVERIRSKLGFKTRAQVASWATEMYGPLS